ncbi:phosphatase PAP2 family protein [Rhodanobacter sp. C03]|uniref:acid phosphatase n=1 Tax=Rhodanobacter sp. C03 TaxID=1945858 RepID=UPI000987126D|nr:phosphatase PAP2 family protein [Rhodanobacter sp. C03]OOG56334.1 hypothetical protein B0E48_09170 [Rhodanobacter sp. C03]
MTARRFLLLAALLLPVVPALAADGSAQTESITDGIDLTLLLAPPPAAGSPTALDDLQAVLAAQAARTADEDEAAKADADRSVFRFTDVLGPNLAPSTLPRTAAFFKRVEQLDKASVKLAKSWWKHPRPSEVSDKVHPLSVEKPGDWSYPSGHATFGYTTAVLLGDMLPEKRAALFDRAALYAHHRVVMGVHFPSDVEAGRTAGTVIAAQLLRDPAWHADFLAARDELRKALMLKPAMGG